MRGDNIDTGRPYGQPALVADATGAASVSAHSGDGQAQEDDAFAADWTRRCQVCSATPVVNATGLCGPCTFGEADTAGGNW